MRCVVGIDPSITSTGVAVWPSVGQPETWVLGTVAGDSLPSRLHELATDLREVLSEYEPILAVIERGFSGGKGPSAWINGTAAGALIEALEDLGIPVVIVPPKVRAKLATGSGSADKIDVLDAARSRLGYVGKQFDEVDALWLALAGAMLLGMPDLPALPKAHSEVIGQYRTEIDRIYGEE